MRVSKVWSHTLKRYLSIPHNLLLWALEYRTARVYYVNHVAYLHVY